MVGLDAYHVEEKIKADDNKAAFEAEQTISLQEALTLPIKNTLDTLPTIPNNHGPYVHQVWTEISALLLRESTIALENNETELDEPAVRAVAEIGGEPLSLEIEGNEYLISLREMPWRSGWQLIVSMERDWVLHSYHLEKGKPTIGGVTQRFWNVFGKISPEDKEILDNGAYIKNIHEIHQLMDGSIVSIPLLSSSDSEELQPWAPIALSFALLSKMCSKEVFASDEKEFILKYQFNELPYDEALEKFIWFKTLTHKKRIRSLFTQLMELQNESKTNNKKIGEIQEELKELSRKTPENIAQDAKSTLWRIKEVHLTFKKVKSIDHHD